MTERRYNKINNTLGWLVFAIAATTYLLTLEPSASFWDCGEYIAQSYRMEVGHPPGNPVYVLAARFFANFASSPENVAWCINAMSAVFSAATIMLLFWTITHLARRLLTHNLRTQLSDRQTIMVMAAGLCGALAYTWSDTFWFSAVEAEVYAFSSLCTALSFWLVLKWENRAEQPQSDRYLVAIAYIVGLSVGVHLLNLLCIPAIVLCIYYRKTHTTHWWSTLSVLLMSFSMIVFILYGMVPGFLKMAQLTELTAVNLLGFNYNSGLITYTALFVATATTTLWLLYRQRHALLSKAAFLLTLALSGTFVLGDAPYLPVLLLGFCGLVLFFNRKTPYRVMSNITLYLTVIFVGLSSYTIVLLRAGAETPINVNAADNVFSLSAYINRDQYGESPLFYGPAYTINASVAQKDKDGKRLMEVKKRRFEKVVKSHKSDPDRYVEIAPLRRSLYAPEMYMFLPRLHNPASAANYKSWVGGINEKDVTAHVKTGDSIVEVPAKMPTYWDNIKFFAVYQFHHMYWRYLLWNFVGRQNDIAGNGEVTHGNWLSGIPVIDNLRLGDQSLLPEELGKGNKGHNVYYGLPMLLGLLGLLWQARAGKTGKRQSWVVFVLFFMTGIAIVVYLNQIPGQARERDYSFAASFYAYAIWIGLGVIGLSRLLYKALCRICSTRRERLERICSTTAIATGILVPLQMVSQTWDDHDRSGRYFCRDYAANVLNSTDPNTILLTSGDNISFPLWYIQDTEGFRTDVRTLNTDYLASYWHIRQLPFPYFEAPGIEMTAPTDAYAYRRRTNSAIADNCRPCHADSALAHFYSDSALKGGSHLKHPVMTAPTHVGNLLAQKKIRAEYAPLAASEIVLNLYSEPYADKRNLQVGQSRTTMADIIVTDLRNGWKRPVCYVTGMAEKNFAFIRPYMAQAGLTLELTPFRQDSYTSVGAGYSDRAYNNFMNFRWRGFDSAKDNALPYYDEVNRYMIVYTRMAMLDLAERLIEEGQVAERAASDPTVYPLLPAHIRTKHYATDRYGKAINLLLLKERSFPEAAAPSNYEFCLRTGEMLYTAADKTGNQAARTYADSLLNASIDRFATHMRYFQTLTCWQPIAVGDKLLYSNGGFLRLLAAYINGNQDKGLRKLTALERDGIDIWEAFRKAIHIAKHQEMPRKPNNRLFNYVYEGYQMLNRYNPEKLQKIMEKDIEYPETIRKVTDYHNDCARKKSIAMAKPAV